MVSGEVERGKGSGFATVVGTVSRYNNSDNPPCPVCRRRFNIGYAVPRPHYADVCNANCVAKLVGCELWEIGVQISNCKPHQLCPNPEWSGWDWCTAPTYPKKWKED